jgi:hypothetical protein
MSAEYLKDHLSVERHEDKGRRGNSEYRKSTGIRTTSQNEGVK